MSSVLALAKNNDHAVVHLRLATLEDRLRRRLRASSYAGLRNVNCDCQEGAVTLRGEVSSYFLKQVAQELRAQGTGRRENYESDRCRRVQRISK